MVDSRDASTQLGPIAFSRWLICSQFVIGGEDFCPQIEQCCARCVGLLITLILACIGRTIANVTIY